MTKGTFFKAIDDVPDDFQMMICEDGAYSNISLVIDYHTKVVEIIKYE